MPRPIHKYYHLKVSPVVGRGRPVVHAQGVVMTARVLTLVPQSPRGVDVKAVLPGTV